MSVLWPAGVSINKLIIVFDVSNRCYDSFRLAFFENRLLLTARFGEVTASTGMAASASLEEVMLGLVFAEALM